MSMTTERDFENSWQMALDDVSRRLRGSHSVVQEAAPFDTWISWQPRQDYTYPQAGWKIHVSPIAVEIHDTLKLVSDLASQYNFAFKTTQTFRLFVGLNGGLMGESQVGKTITIYPVSDPQCLEIFFTLRAAALQLSGPRSPGDFYWHQSDRISLRWGQIGAGHEMYDSLGRVEIRIQTPGGEWVTDSREIPGRLPQSMSPLKDPTSGRSFEALPLLESPEIEIDGARYRLLKNMGRKLKQVWLVANCETDERAVLKRVWRGLGPTYDLHNAESDLANERRHLREVFGYTIKDYSDEFFVGFLMPDMGGESLDHLPLAKARELLPQVLDEVARLHERGLVHRDLKRANLIRRRDTTSIALIDFELAGHVGETLLCSSGTNGYKAPEAERGASYATALDVYALSSIIFDLCLNRDPSYFLVSPQERVDLLRLNGFAGAADLVEALTQEAASRPDLSALRQQIGSIGESIFTPSQPCYQLVSADEISQLVKPTLKCLDRFIVSEGENDRAAIQWRNNHLLSQVCHQGINIGASGLVLGLIELHEARSVAMDHADKNQIADWIHRSCRGLMNAQPYEKAHGLMTGNAGVALALGLAGQKLQCSEYIAAAKERWQIALKVSGDYDLFSGLGGVVHAGLCLGRELRDGEWLKSLEPLIDELTAQVVDYEDTWAWPQAEKFGGAPTLGASHGASGIAMVIARWGKMTDQPEYQEFASEVFKRIFENGRSRDGKYLRYSVLPTSDSRSSAEWCHGASSFLWALINSELNLETDLAPAFAWASESFLDTPISSNPTYCHGLAGQLELAMMMQRVPAFKEKAKLRAELVKRALLLQKRPFAGESFWPSENPSQFTPDLWVGGLGPLVSLVRASDQKTSSVLG